jgi:hypothetical protein
MISYNTKYKRKIEICQGGQCVFRDNCEDWITDYNECPYFIEEDTYKNDSAEVFWEEMSYRKYLDGSLNWNYCFYSDGEY